MNERPPDERSSWPHAPDHRFIPKATYMVTAGTYEKVLLFNTPDKRDHLLSLLFEEARRFAWTLTAWAVLGNHYHFVAVAPEDARTLKSLTKRLHSQSAVWLNRLDGSPGRQVWHQYWDTCLSFEKSYLARLHYVHRNPEKHGLVRHAEDYRWCSMAWFLGKAPRQFRKRVLSLKIDRLSVEDPY